MSVMSLVAFAVAAGTLMILPTGLIGSVFVIGGVAFFGLLALHYFVWGRWLSMELHQMESRDSQEHAAKAIPEEDHG
jgi:hypothetical protein